MPRSRTAVLVLLAALFALAVLAMSTTSGFGSTYWRTLSFWRDTMGMSESAAATATAVTRKALHVPAYALLACLVYLALPRHPRRAWFALLLALAIAVTDEILQSFQPDRGASARDVGVDAVGALLGIAVGRALARRCERAAEGHVRGGSGNPQGQG